MLLKYSFMKNPVEAAYGVGTYVTSNSSLRTSSAPTRKIPRSITPALIFSVFPHAEVISSSKA